MSETHDELMDLLRFSPDDLALNRSGTLSERQMDDLRRKRQRALTICIGFIVAAVILATLMIFFGQVNASPILTIIGIGVTICSAAVTGIFARQILRLTADIDGKKVFTASGKLVRVVKPLNKSVATYILRVGEVEIATSKEVFRLFKHEAKYNLYLTPYTRILISAEAR